MAVNEEFIVSKPASQMRPGDRFIFSEEMGGEGEVVTVVSLADTYGIAVIETEELDFAIEAMSHQWLEIAPELFPCPADCSPELVDGSGEFSWPCTECGRDWIKYPGTGYPAGVTGPYSGEEEEDEETDPV